MRNRSKTMHFETTAVRIQSAFREITGENAKPDEKRAVKEIREHSADAILDRVSGRGIKPRQIVRRILI